MIGVLSCSCVHACRLPWPQCRGVVFRVVVWGRRANVDGVHTCACESRLAQVQLAAARRDERSASSEYCLQVQSPPPKPPRGSQLGHPVALLLPLGHPTALANSAIL
jgi:hypothetical protein